MLKKLFMVACMLFAVQLAKGYEGQKINSKVTRVTVFLNSAQVMRTAAVSITPGTSTLVFDNISPDVDVQSIQVKAAGEFTILSVKHELDYLNEQTKEKRIEELEEQKKLIQDKLDMQNNLLNIYQEESAMLLKNQQVSGQNNNLDLVKLRQALEFQTTRLTDIRKKQQAIKNEIATLNIQLRKFDKQINDMDAGNSKATSNVLVTVSSTKILQAAFTLSYVVKNASWFPVYDIRAKNVNSPINIVYKANVSQQCGEDWRNVKLTLSTGNPTTSGSKPELTPYYLNVGMYALNSTTSITKVTGKVFSGREMLIGATVKVKGTSIGTVTDASGSYSLQVPAGNPVLEYSYIGYETREMTATQPVLNVNLNENKNTLNEVVVVGYGYSNNADKALRGKVAGLAVVDSSIPITVKQIENQTNIEFAIQNPYNIPGDGKQYLVEINSFELPANYQYYVAPKLSTDVFLTATLTDWNKYNFLSGEANLFFEGTFIGKSLIDTRSTNDTLSLSLGVDKSIQVTRTLQKDLKEKKSFGSTRKVTRDWLIAVKNRKSQPVNLLIEDQVPVSQNSSIGVDVQQTSGAESDKLNGKLSWSFMLNSQQDKKLQVKYQVSYPKDQSVIIE
ncbi:mucoidy inhibitor MuiA family protein [Mucilaginibacter sp. JRF]|uniref:DUF4139 domain-containing protein n=1 Tax=Mucilaginibacter sp. JRF TaxID=2780088 RepID=UPI00187FCAA3|nr:DUF4139 domain-containing protein [Mucilaginibacter sp. JRF]MBE9584397.1 mucoidy inhibitor MuiA family protein [Mucilaginibacter sp. JRF]